jgi:LuxR family maltose regulon positive regulatory protein
VIGGVIEIAPSVETFVASLGVSSYSVTGDARKGLAVWLPLERATLEPVTHGTPSVERGQVGAVFEDRLLATKLYAPHTRSSLVARPRLIERLDDAAKGRLIVVWAPAGFGKTTLLGEWILRSESSVGWVSLDEGDNDPATFFAYLVAALRTVEAGIGEDETSPLRSSQPPTRARLTTLVNELAAIPHDLTLVLDDYHLIEDVAVHAALAFLLEHLPPQMHLVVASRTEPPLSISRLLAGGHLTQLTARDLRFTPGETARFLNEAMGLDLPVEAIAALEERTEGWIAGLQLAALSMRGRNDVSKFVSAFTGTNRHVFDYLAEEVLDRQTEDARTFLLQTSILDRLSGPLCDAVTRRGNGQPMLEQLERMNLLIVPLDDQRRWYRYHHLFSDFLRQRLRREDPQLASEVHSRASVWHERNGTAREAVGHALASGDLERAAALIEVLAETLYGHGEGPAVDRLVNALPEEVIRTRPRLYLAYVVGVLMVGDRWEEAEAALQELEHRLGLGGEGKVELPTPGTPGEAEHEELAYIVSYIATARANVAYQARGDLPGAIALNRRALELLVGTKHAPSRTVAAVNLAECLLDIGDLPATKNAIEEAIEFSRAVGHTAHLAGALIHLGRLQTIKGHLSEAMKTYEHVLRLAVEHDDAGLLLDVGVSHLRMGELLFEWDDLEAATRHISEGIERSLEWIDLGEVTSRLLDDTATHDRLGRLEAVEANSAHGVVPGYIALARVRQAQGDTDGALEALRNVTHVAWNSRISPLWKDRAVNWGKAWQARLLIVQGDLRTAARWAQDRELSAEEDPDYSSELEYLTLARLLIAQDRHEEAASLLDRMLQSAEAGGRRRTVIEVLVLRSLVLRARNDTPGALATLRRALTLAEPEGYIRTFADEGKPMADLLQRLLKDWRKERPDDVPLAYASRLLQSLGVDVKAPSGTDVRDTATLILDPMTGRELEVLKLLDSDLSTRQIAATLFISLDTVKSHTRHLYAKLGVHNRHQAVARARDLKLL